MKHFILGTAGHIDHGKTLLVKALTGIDCDTHDEEKKRGITIHLGFAHLDFPTGEVVGIVDMPGHKDFIHTMVSGATGIDIALLVISADSGIMPQTREHLWIMQTLGIEKGLVAMTKVDIVDSETAEIAEEDIKSFIKGTFLEKNQIIRVSSVTGQGLENLRKSIYEIIENSEPRTSEGNFRMYPDRIFNVPGFGSVLTGSVIEGKLKKEDRVLLLPGYGKEYRIRRMERHKGETDEIVAGDRASINIVGLDKEEFKRGSLISDRSLTGTKLLDARITLFREGKKMKIWNNAIFLFGTQEQQTKIHLISSNGAEPGESADVQIHLSKEVYARYGDRFILRSTSDDITLGGGYVTDPSPFHHRRRTEKVKKKLSSIADGGLVSAIIEELKKHSGIAKISELSQSMNIHEAILLKTIQECRSVTTFTHKKETVLALKEDADTLRKRMPQVIKSFMDKNPFLNRGPTSEEIKNAAWAKRDQSFSELILILLEELKNQGIVKKTGENWSIAGESESLDSSLNAMVGVVYKYIEDLGMGTPRYEELVEHAGKNKIGEKELKLILNYLVQTKKIYRIEGEFLSAKIVQGAKEALKNEIGETEKGITVAGFRDLIGANRKISLLLFSLFDSEGFTVRNGDLRFLRLHKNKPLSGESL